MNAKSKILVGFLVWGLLACSPSRRLDRLLRKNPELVKTTYVIDTIVVERVTRDTITKIVKHDSVTVINNERVRLRYFYDTLRQEIHHEVECKEVIKPYIKEVHTVEAPSWRPPWWLYLLIVGGVLVYILRK